MNRPMFLVFGASIWRIKWRKNLGDLSGQTEKVKNVINVSTSQSTYRQKSTLVHEALHAALEGTNVSQMAGYTEELEEAFVAALEGPLMELLLRVENNQAMGWVRS